MAEIHIRAELRDPSKSTCRALRRTGRVPGIYYNRQGEVRCLQLDEHTLTNLLNKEIGVLHVEMDGETLPCIIREVQRHPVRRSILHIDLMGILSGQRIKAHVPIRPTGSAAGVKEGGTLELTLREVEVECEASHLPTHLDIDVSHLHIHDAVRVRDLHYEGIAVHGDPETVVVHVIPQRTVVVEVAPSTEVKEPEVIRERKPEAGEKESE